MTLTIDEENIFRKQIDIQKFEQQLTNIIPSNPILTPTKDAEILTLKQQIKDEEIHTTRAEYIKKVQPMKNNYRMLIAQNKQIETENKMAIDVARNTDDSIRKTILDQVNIAKNELNVLLGGI